MIGRQILALALAAALLAACGGPAAQTAQTSRYTVTLRVEGAGTAERRATVEITDRQGQPAVVDQVVIAPVMRDMGMASPEVVAAPDGPGRYTARAAFFSMAGAWELDVRVASAGVEETVTFPVLVE